MRDRPWVNRILRGDKAAGERLVTQNYQRVYGMLRSLCANREVAEDLTQQTFVKAWAALPSFRGEARLSTWICRIAYHEFTHWRRDRREFASLERAEQLPDLKAAAGLRTVLFAQALEYLGEELRETFLLYYEQEFDVKEIAALLEIPPGTVKSRLYTARNRLRELLTESSTAKAEESVPQMRPTNHSITPQLYATVEEKPS